MALPKNPSPASFGVMGLEIKYDFAKEEAWLIPGRGSPILLGGSGSIGPQGADGVNGQDGAPGADGSQGQQGIQGVQGNTGVTGSPGTDGSVGPQGSPGAPGLDGDDGATGQAGTAGADGAPGAQGNPGADGNDGVTGSQGIQGIQGVQGVPGNDGGSGVTKISGDTGAFVADTTWETLSADSSGITSQTQTTVMTMTGLGAGIYRVKGVLIWKSALTTTGIGITLNHTGTLTQFVSTWWTTTTGGAAATGVADQVTAVAAGQLIEGKSERVKDTRSSFNVGTDTNLGAQLSVIEALMIVSVTGQLELKIASEIAASAVTLMAGSTLEVNRVA